MIPRTIRLLSVLCVVALLLSASEGRAASEKVVVKKLPPLSFGLTGYAGADEARSDAGALQAYLSQKLGRAVTTRVYPTPSALAAGLASGEIDLAWLQPFTLIEAQGKGPITPLVKAVRRGLPFYRGVLFTLADKNIDGLKGLKGLSVAWVDRSSAAGYLFPRAAIVQAGLSPADLFKTETFRGDHVAVCRAVLEGSADVGATYADDRPGAKMEVDGCSQSVGPDAAKKLKILDTSAPIPNDAIAARPGLDPAEMERIRKVFLGLRKDARGQPVLLGVFKAEGFDTVGAEDFTPVKFAADAVTK
jgi:phosphate/phosphite/phosphonate ABC transporter binding protein